MKPPKYRNKKTEVLQDGKLVKYDSKREAKVGSDLRLREKAGEISDLQAQTKFSFWKRGIHICDYIADFTFWENGRKVVMDVKSPITRKNPVYRIKAKMMRAFYGIEIVEVA
jgi:Protein of unknown function (DUF1064)